jgi:hypothetical protein
MCLHVGVGGCLHVGVGFWISGKLSGPVSNSRNANLIFEDGTEESRKLFSPPETRRGSPKRSCYTLGSSLRIIRTFGDIRPVEVVI